MDNELFLKNISKIIDEGWTLAQLKELALCFKLNVDPSPWMNPKYSAEQMEELRLAAEVNIDSTLWMDPKYSAYQMEEFRLSVLNGIDPAL